jgi:hypothetical protein
VPASAAFVALIAAGCGGAGSVPSTHAKPRRTYTYSSTAANTVAPRTTTAPAAPSPAAIRRAAALTAAKSGFRAAVTARITIPQLSSNPLLAVGRGYFDPSSNSGTLNMAVTLPGLLSLAGPLPTKVILVDDEAYVQVPAGLTGELPTTASWLDASLAELDVSSASPSVILQQIARDATSTVPDQRARVVIDPSTGLVRSLTLNYSEPRPGYRVSVRLRFTGFGSEPASQAPPAAEVGDLSAALRELGF